jgi:catechol 2,3-dioxygenase-like lactoylglutathione lyase family enzyme
MLASAKMIGFLVTTDYEKTKAFFVDKLGFQLVSQDQYGLVMRCGGNTVRVSKLPNFSPLQGTVLGWEVSEIEKVVGWLKERGITPEKYPFMKDAEIRTFPTGDRVCWFKDPDGNILSVSQHATAA